MKPRTPNSDLPPPAPKSTSSLFNMDLPPPSKLKLPRRKSRRWLWWLLVPAIFIVVAIGGTVGTLAWYNNALQPKSGSGTTVAITVESGASVDQVAKELEQKGVVQSATAFSLYMKLNNKAIIKTGSYYFAPNQSVAEIVQWLNDGRVGTHKVTILPGKTLKQIKQTLIDDGFTEADVTAAFAKTYSSTLFVDKPAAATLEGYIFPETYFVTAGSPADQLLTRSFDEFQKRIDAEGLRQKLAARGFSLYQGITLASIVAQEVTNPTDQHQVAQVFETRLAQGMMLGSDVTYHYAAGLLGVAPSADIDSPYNTRIHTGLPPGPVGNFNLAVLEAVAEPSAGSYLYFVAGDDGTTHYATTLSEHQQNIKNYCKTLCAQE